MKPEIKKLWVEALRSGDYKQGHGRLARIKDKQIEYCCLGVLCEVLEVPREKNNGYFTYEEGSMFPPNSAYQAAGLIKGTCINYDGTEIELHFLNDSYPLSFKQIADLIEAQL
jgi:hypothetical protein